MAQLHITALLAILLLFLSSVISATTVHTYRDCTTSQRENIDEWVAEVMTRIKQVVEADGIPDDWVEPGEQPPTKGEVFHLTRLSIAVLQIPPALTFICPKPGSTVGRYCSDDMAAGSFDASEANWLLPERWDRNSLTLCPAPQIEGHEQKMNTGTIHSVLLNDAEKRLEAREDL
ncbi:uncharacterized protein CLAFUR5_10264 [Fulvia fulva]|uniref:Uncharacterized protein n=1 Tax=Passalora fulva TaxID=5499 RepID=A0A9Q8URI9_PASFU|nr:uncharacterized protein CLAFUR5_10264 [Fulvia fulva]UJO19767.1 hypothetical protein CLAFUR5_10264 [Fulvia fulva]